MGFRPMRRFKQQLSDTECIELLTKEKRGVLSLIGDDGYPYGIPLDFVYDSSRLYFHSAKEGHKLDALKRCGKACFTVYNEGEKPENDWAYYVKSVIVFGKARLLDDREDIIEKCRLLGLKYYPDPASVEEELRKDGDRAAVIELSIEHMTGKRVHEK